MTTSHWDTFVYGFFFGAGWAVSGGIWAAGWATIVVLLDRLRARMEDEAQ